MNAYLHRIESAAAANLLQRAAAALRGGGCALALALAALVPLGAAGCASRDAAAANTAPAHGIPAGTAAADTVAAAAAPATAAKQPDAGATQIPDTARHSTAAETLSHLHVDRDYGFSITVPAGVELRETFTPSALDSAQWQYGATAPTSGSARVALLLPGSNNITTGELRVGVSMAPNSVRQCTQIPTGAHIQPGTVTLDRIGFTNFRQEDAGMNHFLTADSYRAVQKGRCYAIDLLVYGTNPQVYNPPATAPFSREQARMQLQNMLPGFRFLP